MTDSEIRVLQLCDVRRGGATAQQVAAHLFPGSKKPMVRMRNWYRAMRKMEKLGWIVGRGNPNIHPYTSCRFFLTAAGRKAGMDATRADRTISNPVIHPAPHMRIAR